MSDGSWPRRQPNAAALLAGDAARRTLDIEVVDVGVGTATCRWTVTPEWSNGLGMCHGGLVFTLADTAMGYASNSEVDAVAATATIDFLRPASVGATLLATATQTDLTGRTAFYEIRVTDGDGELVARFHGRCRRLPT